MCEFKDGSFSHEVRDENISTINLLAPSAMSSLNEPTITEHVAQSSLIYSYHSAGKMEKFISGSFPFDQTTLKFYVLNHKVMLYIDKLDRRNYVFDLEK